jgi:HSP20 family protein
MTLVKSHKKNGDSFPSVFSDFFDNDRFFSNPWLEKVSNVPAVNINETDEEFDVELAAPGYKKTDLKVDIDDNVLTIKAEKKAEKNEESKHFTRKEFSYSSFSRSFTLPQSVNADKIDAKYNDGILKLVIPKKEEKKAEKKRRK